nr:immunoglobulin light chain junction region [Macaca mulatta]
CQVWGSSSAHVLV